MFNAAPFLNRATWVAFLLFLAACAPSPRDPKLAEDEDDAAAESVDAAAAPRAADIRVGDPTRPDAPGGSGEIAEATPAAQAPTQRFDPKNPDWEVRARMLYEHYLTTFQPPQVGQTVEMTLANGRVQQGVLEELSESHLLLNIGSGSITLHPESLNETSRARFFARDHARVNAMRQGRSEYARWQEAQEAARRPPPRQEPPQTREVAQVDPVTRPHRSNPNAPPPRNEGPAGRVAQVDQYIRQNAAIPHSLRIESWGRVQQDANGGYRVRVRYSLQGADGFGRTNEDMVFFMHPDGTVHRRAPYRGN